MVGEREQAEFDILALSHHYTPGVISPLLYTPVLFGHLRRNVFGRHAGVHPVALTSDLDIRHLQVRR
jgi:hypothetical protein